MAPEYIIVPVEVAHREFLPVEKQPKRPKPEKKERGKVGLAEAKEIMKEKDFMGPDELKAIYGVEIKDVPPILFSAPELAEAKERGEFLILRMNTLPNGKTLSMQNLHVYFANDFKVLSSPADDWKVKSSFFTGEAPSVSWALVSKECIPNSTGKNYYEQTHSIISHLKNEVYKNSTMPEKYEDAIKEFEAYVKATFGSKTPEEIKALLQSNDWTRYAEQLANLKINQLCRHSGTDILSDLATYYKHNKERLLPSTVTWTKSRGSDGDLVSVGSFDADGANMSRWLPGLSDGGLGVLLSRTA